MRRLIGWVLILWPAGVLVLSLLGMGLAAATGGYAAGEAREALLVLGMGAAVALLPIGLGVWLVRGLRRDQQADVRRSSTRASTRELIGWALTVPGIATGAVWVADLGGSDGSARLLGVGQAAFLGLLLATGVWIVVAERRRRRQPTRDQDPGRE